MAESIDATLGERNKRYGNWREHARIAQNIKAAMRDSPNWDQLTPSMRETFEMFAQKAGRILNGDPFYDDSWHDIIGYFKLIENQLKEADLPMVSGTSSELNSKQDDQATLLEEQKC